MFDPSDFASPSHPSPMESPRAQAPRYFTVRQSFTSRSLDDVAAEVTAHLQGCDAMEQIQAGQSVAVAVGSRGIDRIDEVARAVAAAVIARGAHPFVVPAMGSHGGATAEGQRSVLATLGVTPDAIGCPINASMETTVIGQADCGIPIHFDKLAAQADHVIPINRIKPHTRLTGTIQSGLCKMLMIGLGKHSGAVAFHQAFKQFDYRLDAVAPDIVGKIVAQLPILLGIALLEDSYDKIGQVTVLPANALLKEEPELLETADDWMPSLPFEQADLLIVDEIGKEISGTGMDTNIIGRKWNDRIAHEDEWPKIDQIYVRSLTKASAGNATGIGVAEFTHRRVAEAIDREKTAVNCVTSGHVSAGALPVYYDSDREVLAAVFSQLIPPYRWMWIRNTLDIAEVECSEVFSRELFDRPDLEVIREPAPLRFDDAGDLIGPG